MVLPTSKTCEESRETELIAFLAGKNTGMLNQSRLVVYCYDSRTANKALHLTTIPLRSVAAGEL